MAAGTLHWLVLSICLLLALSYLSYVSSSTFTPHSYHKKVGLGVPAIEWLVYNATAFPFNVTQAQCTSPNMSSIYVVGGKRGDNAINDVWYISLYSEDIHKVASSPALVRLPGHTVSFNTSTGYSLISVGSSDSYPTNDVVSSTDGGETWQTRVQTGFSPRTSIAVALIPGTSTVILTGGQGVFNESNTWMNSDGIGQIWEKVSNAQPWGAYITGSALVALPPVDGNSTLVLVGGESDTQNPPNTVYYSFDTGVTWQDWSSAPWSPRINMNVVAQGNTIVAVGGVDASTIYNDVYMSTVLAVWTLILPTPSSVGIPPPLSYPCVSLIPYDGELYLSIYLGQRADNSYYSLSLGLLTTFELASSSSPSPSPSSSSSSLPLLTSSLPSTGISGSTFIPPPVIISSTGMAGNGTDVRDFTTTSAIVASLILVLLFMTLCIAVIYLRQLRLHREAQEIIVADNTSVIRKRKKKVGGRVKSPTNNPLGEPLNNQI